MLDSTPFMDFWDTRYNLYNCHLLGHKVLAAIPGSISKNMGNTFIKLAITQPALAWVKFLADSPRCTIT